MNIKKLFTLTIIIFLLSGLVLAKEKKKVTYKNKITLEYGFTHDYKSGESFKKLEKKIVVKYNNKGNLIERAVYKSIYKSHRTLSLIEKRKYKYDIKGNKIEEVEYRSDGSPLSKIKYKYDNKGNIIGKAYHKPNGSLDWKREYKYKYDKKGNKIKERRNIPGNHIKN